MSIYESFSKLELDIEISLT